MANHCYTLRVYDSTALVCAIILSLAPAINAGDGNASFQPFGTVEITPAFQIDGQGLNIDSIDFWDAPDSSNTLMFVTAKGNSRVEVWQFPFVDNELSPIVHRTFGTSRVNGVVVDQESNLLYISVGKPASTVSVFSIPDLKFVMNFNKDGANFQGEPNLTLLKLSNGDKRIYVSADDIVFIHDAVTGAFLNEFTPTKGLETMAADDFYQRLYIPDENGHTGVYVYNPDGTPHEQNGSNVFGGDNIFQSDAEGIIVCRCPDHGQDSGRGLIVISDQRKQQNEYEFFDRQSWQHLGTLKITGVSNTDGVGSIQAALPGFPLGLFAAINDDGTTVGLGWDVVFAATGLACPTDTAEVCVNDGDMNGAGRLTPGAALGVFPEQQFAAGGLRPHRIRL
ncbi:MAG: phytase [Caldithrix sp.]|nr:MAG: phytase [Caldithrix sp.]